MKKNLNIFGFIIVSFLLVIGIFVIHKSISPSILQKQKPIITKTENVLTEKKDIGAGVLQVVQGGTGAATLTGCLTGNGTAAITGTGSACGSGGGGGGGDPFTHPRTGLSATTTSMLVGTSTSSGNYQFTVGSSTAPQIALSAGAGVSQWTFRNAGGNLYVATTTVDGTATSTLSALAISSNGYVGVASSSPFQTFSVVGNEWHNGNYFHYGSVVSSNSMGSACSQVTNCFEFVGTNNTTDGVNMSLQNTSAGASAYSGYTVLNDLAGTATTNYGGVYINSSVYNDNTFGSIVNFPSLMQVANSMGPVSIGSFPTTTPYSYINFSTGAVTAGSGHSTTNERMRIVASGNIGIGTTTPWALLSVNPNALGSGVPEFAIGSTTKTDFYVDGKGFVGIGTTSPQVLISIGTSTPSTTANGGIGFAGDPGAVLYRSAAATLDTDGALNIGTLASNDTLSITANSVRATSATQNGITIGGSLTSSQAFNTIITGTSNRTAIVGTSGEMNISGSFQPTSGTGSFTALQVGHTINQTVTASGITRGLYLNPTLTVARDYHAIETAPYTFTIGLATTTLIQNLLNPMTIASTSARTVTNAIGTFIPQPPIASTNITLSTSTALLIGGPMPTIGSATTVAGGGTVTTAYGAQIYAPAGAGTNIALQTTGTVFMPALTTASGLQTGDMCLDANSQLINDAALCLASDARAKMNILSLPSALDEIMKLRPVSYKYTPEFNGKLQNNPNYSGEQVGLIAQEVQKIDPRLIEVYTQDHSKDANHAFSVKAGEAAGVRYENMVALAIKGIQELAVAKGVAVQAKRSAEENWQWGVIALLAIGFIYQQKQIINLKKKYA